MFLKNLFQWIFILAVIGCAGSLIAEDEAASKSKKWDVASHTGPADTVRMTVTSGTWMNLDVSPDGRFVVFDLLGDIYELPITGGNATLLSGGLPYEVQPRYSPDGSKISFTSDRGGADNIWVMNRDGSDARQVTKESFRLLNNAVWTPDGQYLIARKHFTSRRSLGAGEMWMYHISGGKGLQLTERKNDQQDAGEPDISPDGRYLYFSEDMSGGSTFQYNKDPNTQIYVVRRLDLKRGDLTTYVAGQGGAVRPQISPDGKHLAFVRRVRSKSVLYIHEVETGRQWPVFDRLNKDQQEAWAIFGVYPNYAWLPGGKEVVIWAEGHLWRVDVFQRKAIEIPFKVSATHSIARALRFRQTVHPEAFNAKMISGAITSADGKWLVFNAVGQLWKMKLANGKVERLTKDNQFREMDPDISADNKWVVYSTWNDTLLGGIRKVPLRGGKSQALNHRKGYFYNPRFSPDGTIIVFQRGSGNSQLGFVHGVEPGIYWIPATGGIGNLVTKSGSNARFSKSPERIYFQSFSNGNRILKSCALDGSDELTHFSSGYATDIIVSPDERWVAFQELFNVYITPFPKTGGSVELSAKSSAIPVKKVSRDAGTYLHWSKNSDKLHWTIGPEYFTRELKESFTFVEGAADSLAGPDSAGMPIKLVVDSDIPSGQFALSGARLITMKGDLVIENGVILINRNRIQAIGKRGEVRVPATAKTIDVTGKTIMPGIIDVHAHAGHFSNNIPPQQNWPYLANLTYGVTTMHDPSATTEVVFSQAELVRAGRMIGPRVFSTGTILYGAEGNFKAVINSLDDARSHLRRMKAVGAFSVKSYNQPRRNQRQQVIQAARELEMMVYPEGGSFFFHNLSMVLDGHTGIEHNVPVTPVYEDVIKLWSASGTGYTPTLVVAYGSQSGERYWYQETKVWEQERLLNFTPRQIVDARSRRRSISPDDEYGHIGNAADCKLLADAGVKVNVGGHGQLQGLAPHWEIWMLVQGGMTPLEALRAATLNGAYYIGMDHDLGSLEAGKLADLVVMDANPLENIRNTEKISRVVANGRIYDAATMNEVGNHPRKRYPMYWQDARSSDAFIWQDDAGFGGVGGCGCHRH